MDGLTSEIDRDISETSDFESPSSPPGKRRLRRELIAMATDALVIWDILSIAAAGCVCALAYGRFWYGPTVSHGFFIDARNLSLIGGLLAAFVLRGERQGRPRQVPLHFSLVTLNQGIVGRVVLLVGLLLAVMFLTRIGDRIPRLWLLMWSTTILVVAFGGRCMLFLRLRALEARGVMRERVAVIGRGALARQLVSRLNQERSRAIDLMGVFDEGADGAVNDCARLVELGKQNELDWVILAMSAPAPARIKHIVHNLKALDVQVAFCLPVQEPFAPDMEICHFDDMAMMVLVNRPIAKWGLLIKDLIDKIVSVLAIVVFAPLLAVIAIAIRFDSPGPAIFRQKRLGRNNVEFEMFKFRTMHVSSQEASDGRFQQTQRNDKRVTRLGAFLRKSSLDELPQLFNVLRGDMSLVGPRPHAPGMRTDDRLCAEISAEYMHRHRVKPGITGWAQINGYRGATATAEQVRRRVEHDLHYIEHWSLLLDLKILARTPVALALNRSNAF